MQICLLIQYPVSTNTPRTDTDVSFVQSSSRWTFDCVFVCVRDPPSLPFLHSHGSCVFSKAAQTVRTMLKVAKNAVPRLEWKRTPVLLRATAGLRLLPAGKAQALLDQVKHRNGED